MSDQETGARLSRPAFTVCDHTFSWSEVLLAARVWGVWSECERAARDALARLQAAGRDGSMLGQQELHKAERDFRRSRGLRSGEELDSWLEHWQLDREAWRDYVHAQALCERGARSEPAGGGERAPARGEHVPEAAQLARASWAHAVCTGSLERALHRMAGIAAAASAHGAKIADRELDEAELAEFEREHASFCEAAVDARALEREIELRALDWTHFELRYLACDEEDVAREAALCVREDGMDIEQVAAEAGLDLQRQSTELEALHRDLRSKMLGEPVGGIVGPLPIEGAWRLVEVLERRAPTLEDAALRKRAARVVAQSAVEAEVVNRVRWHERV